MAKDKSPFKKPLKAKRGDWGISREDILTRARIECLTEMYAKAQPAYDLTKFIDESKAIKKYNPNWKHPDDSDTKWPLYLQHYLSEAEFEYIRDKYIKAYGLDSHWKPDIDLLLNDLKEGVKHDVYKEYRRCETLPGLVEQIGQEAADKVEYLIKECRDWYRFDREESDFRCAIALGGSPCSCAKTVKEYWATKGIELEIVERNPDYFWYWDQGWTDQEIEEEFSWAEERGVTFEDDDDDEA